MYYECLFYLPTQALCEVRTIDQTKNNLPWGSGEAVWDGEWKDNGTDFQLVLINILSEQEQDINVNLRNGLMTISPSLVLGNIKWQ